MKTGASRLFQRSLLVAAAGILALMLAACTGRGGGQLPPGGAFKAAASFGFTFSCQDSGGLNPPTGQLKIELSYTDKGINPLGSSFGIHGTVDTIDPVLESMICIGQNPPEPDPNLLTFLGRYRLTTAAPSEFPSACKTPSPVCRFEVTVRDNDEDLAPSPGDFFSIKLSSATALSSQLPAATVFYARAGTLKSGNLTVD
jgi:hypothetical protein